MNKNTKFITHAALLGAMYFALPHMQNLLLPNSANFAIQFRLSEALCVLAFFTPAAIPGLTVGCLLFNLSYAGALPLDWLVGSAATLGACGCMRLTRHLCLRELPLWGLLMPAVWNALLVGWELTVYLGDTGFTAAAFWLNALTVAIGEAAVLLTFGVVLYRVIARNRYLREMLGDL